MNSDEVQQSSLVEPVVQPRSSGWSSSLFSNTLFLLIVDLLLGGLAYTLAWLIRIYVPFPLTLDLLPQERWDAVNHLWGLLLVSQGFFLYIFGMYDDLRVLRYREVLGHIVTACFGQVVVVTSVFYLTNGIFPRSVILVFGLVNVIVLTVWRAYVKSCLHADTLRVLLVAEDLDSADEIAREIDRNPWMGLKIIGLVTAADMAGGSRAAGSVPVLGSLEDTAEVIEGHGIDEVIFASRHSWKDRVLNSLSQLQLARPLRIAIRPSVFEIAIGRLRHINIYDTPLIEVRRNPNEPLSRLVKRSFDLLISAILSGPSLSRDSVGFRGCRLGFSRPDLLPPGSCRVGRKDVSVDQVSHHDPRGGDSVGGDPVREG